MSKDKASRKPKKKNTKKSRPKQDNIEKSKQLTGKFKICRRNSCRSSNDNIRVYDNGKPMPPLSELEKMFEDSDEDEHPKIVTQKKNHLRVSSSSMSSELTSPTTIKKIANRMMDMISNLPNSTSVNEYPMPIVLTKKRKKIKDMDEECPKIQIKRSREEYKTNGDVAVWLEDCEKSDYSDGSNDSNKTVIYNLCRTPNVNGRPHSFSPLPSTSRDRETITKNEKLFNESLLSETAISEEKPIAINETKTDLGTDFKLLSRIDKKSVIDTNNDNDIEIFQSPCETIVIDDDIEFSKPVKIKNINNNNLLECIEIIEPDVKKENLKLQDSETIIIDDNNYYESINYSPVREDVTDIIDIDDIIAENKAIIEKYSKDTKKDINTVTFVDSSTISNTNSKKYDSSSTHKENESRHINMFQSNQINNNQHHNASNNRRQNNVHSHTPYSNRCHHYHHPEQINNRQDLDSDSDYIPHERICDKSHRHHTSSEHFHIFRNFESRHVNNNYHHYHHPEQINNRQNLDSDSDFIPHERICDKNHQHHTDSEHFHIFGNLESRHVNNRNSLIHNNQDYNRTNNRSSVQQPTPSTAPNLTSPIKNLGDCPICMDSLAKKAVASTICGHIFCLKCIEAVFKTSGKKCPTCRKTLKKGGYHQIFL